MNKTNIPAAPEGYSTVNPFIITEEAEAVIAFIFLLFVALKVDP